MVMNDMENKNTSSTTNEGLKEIDKQTNPVMYGWRCPVLSLIHICTLSMIEFQKKHPDKLVAIIDVENAFDIEYAKKAARTPTSSRGVPRTCPAYRGMSPSTRWIFELEPDPSSSLCADSTRRSAEELFPFLLLKLIALLQIP